MRTSRLPMPLAGSLVLAAALPAVAAGLPTGAASQAVAALPLGASEQGRRIFEEALGNLSLDVQFRFLDKTYKNDVYVRDPITGNKVRTACVRFKATSGFRFAIDPPRAQLTPQGLTLELNVARLEADALAVKFQLGPCTDIAGGFGVRLRDVKIAYKARPLLESRDGGCSVHLNPLPSETRISIGDLNILGVQNDLDGLAKDAVREGLNASIENFFSSVLGGSLVRAASRSCGAPARR